MDIEIKPLTPDLAEAYARFFDATPHDDGSNKAELPCYCVTWRSDASYEKERRHWFATREERRERAVEYIREGSLRGHLAYCGGEIVGWCNATGDCQGGVNYLRADWPIEEYRAGVRVLSVFCFMVAPGAQRMGVATALLEAVCRSAAAQGFDWVEAYPARDYVAPDCRGPLAMYEKCGFHIRAEREGRVVVRKALRGA